MKHQISQSKKQEGVPNHVHKKFYVCSSDKNQKRIFLWFFVLALVQISDEVTEETAKTLDPIYTIEGSKHKKFVIVNQIQLPTTISLRGELGVFAINDPETIDAIEAVVIKVC